MTFGKYKDKEGIVTSPDSESSFDIYVTGESTDGGKMALKSSKMKICNQLFLCALSKPQWAYLQKIGL